MKRQGERGTLFHVVVVSDHSSSLVSSPTAVTAACSSRCLTWLTLILVY